MVRVVGQWERGLRWCIPQGSAGAPEPSRHRRRPPAARRATGRTRCAAGRRWYHQNAHGGRRPPIPECLRSPQTASCSDHASSGRVHQLVIGCAARKIHLQQLRVAGRHLVNTDSSRRHSQRIEAEGGSIHLHHGAPLAGTGGARTHSAHGGR